MLKERKISNLQPVQIETVEIAKNAYIRGRIGEPTDVVGSTLASKITLDRNTNVRLPDGTYQVKVTVAGAAGTGKYQVIDVENGTVTAEITTAAGAQAGVIAGVNITVTDTDGCAKDDVVEFVVYGDQTRIIPGTVIGRVKDKEDPRFGLWVPAYDDTINTFDVFRVVNGYQQTDKSKLTPEDSFDVNISTNYITSAIVFGEVFESVLRDINLTDTLKAKLTGIVWA